VTEPKYNIAASTFQEPLIKLAEVLAQKVKREAPKLLQAPPYVSMDLHVLIRQAMYTYNVLFYLNADERRENDCHWRAAYSIVTLPLIRNMIDCLYNITAILQDPNINGAWFRKSGFKKLLEAFDDEERRYRGRPEWDEWIRNGRDWLDFEMRKINLTEQDIQNVNPWRTLGRYVNEKQPGGTFTRHQEFLRTFTYGRWREYSAMAHGGFEGLTQVAVFYIADSLPHDDRPKIEASHLKLFSTHIARAALMLLCIVTELQAYFHFDDDGSARINERIHEVWNALMPVFEVQELYKERYEQLMKDKRIDP
jgi:hypothetical protein